jgi:hypothetical protein
MIEWRISANQAASHVHQCDVYSATEKDGASNLWEPTPVVSDVEALG